MAPPSIGSPRAGNSNAEQQPQVDIPVLTLVELLDDVVLPASPTPSLSQVPRLIADGSDEDDDADAEYDTDSEGYSESVITAVRERLQQSNNLARRILMSQRTEKICFVTIGATAKFDALIEAVLSDDFLDALAPLNYTRIRIQYGESGVDFFTSTIKKCQDRHDGHVPHLIAVDGFEFAVSDFGQEMRAAKAENGRLEGMIVTAAGASTLTEATRFGVPVLAVPNPTLAENHQVQLAKRWEINCWALHAPVEELAAHVSRAEAWRVRNAQWPPPNAGPEPWRPGTAGILDDEMGFLD